MTDSQVHHILAQVIQGGLVLETNVDEIAQAGECFLNFITLVCALAVTAAYIYTIILTHIDILSPPVDEAAQARKSSFLSANPLALGTGSGARGSALQAPLGWLTGRFSAAGGR